MVAKKTILSNSDYDYGKAYMGKESVCGIYGIVRYILDSMPDGAQHKGET